MRTTSRSPALIAMPDSRNHLSSKSARKSLQWVRPPGTALCAPPDVFVLRQRLASKLAWWKDAGACRQILRTIRHGVHLEFVRKPHPFQARPIPVPDRWRPWLHQELDRAIAAGAYEAATCTDFVAPAFIIKQRNKLRLVINFRQINKSCIDMSCRYEGLRDLRHLLQRNDWMLSLDLQDAYWHIPVAQDHRKYLTFCIDGRTLQCAALPFGWKGSPLTFTKVMRAFVKYLRSRGIRCLRLPYLDDLAFFISGSRSRALSARDIIEEALRDAGLIRKASKGRRLDSEGLQGRLGADTVSSRSSGNVHQLSHRHLLGTISAPVCDCFQCWPRIFFAALLAHAAAFRLLTFARVQERPPACLLLFNLRVSVCARCTRSSTALSLAALCLCKL